MVVKVNNLVLHIGNSKTGTSAIQKWLADNTARLSEAGVLYPQAGRQGNAHHPVAALMRAQANPSWVSGLTIETYIQDIQRELSEGHYQTVILSSEIFWQAHDFSVIRAAFEHAKIKVVALVRRQDRWAESMYGHQVKTSSNVEPPGAWIDRRPHAFDYSIVLGRWAFQLDNITMRVMDFDQACGEGLLPSFAQSAGFAHLLGDTSTFDKVNVSLADEALQLFRAYKACCPQDNALDGGRPARKILEEYSEAVAGQKPAKSFFSSQEHAKIAAYSQHGNEWLRKATKGRIKFAWPLTEADEKALVRPKGEANVKLKHFLQSFQQSGASAEEKQLCATFLELLAKAEQG